MSVMTSGGGPSDPFNISLVELSFDLRVLSYAGLVRVEMAARSKPNALFRLGMETVRTVLLTFTGSREEEHACVTRALQALYGSLDQPQND